MGTFVDFTAKRSGRYKLYRDGVEISAHNAERELHEKLWDILLKSPQSDISYVHDYKVNCVLTSQGITLAQTFISVNAPPVIDMTPAPSFVQGTANTYDMSQNFTDDGQSTVLTSLTNILPNGLAYNGTTHILSYDGIGIQSVSQHQLQVNDQVNSIVTSAVFNISIETVALLTIPNIGVEVGNTHDMSQYIVDTGSLITDSQILNINTSFATYSHATKLMTGVAIGLMTNLQLEVTFP